VSSVGSFVDRFERMVADYLGVRHAVALINGTGALHIALLVTGVQPGDEVLVSTLAFIAPANAVRYVGARPVFIDAEPGYWQMDPAKVADFVERRCRWVNGELRNKVTGRRVKAIVPVHILGHPCDINPILEIVRKYRLSVVEDATESLGARYRNQMVGRFGDVACFSFNGNKLITTGGGGMIGTDDETIARRARYLTTQAKDDPVEFVHGEIGYNYRLTDVQAALGCAQAERLEEHIAAKRRIAARYARAFIDVPGLEPMPEAPWAFSVYWMYTVLVDDQRYGIDSRALLRKLERAGIQARPLWQPLHLGKPHAECEVVSGEVAERLNRQAISLPCSVGLTEADQERVIETVRDRETRR
jgi:perosamine synthetase